MMFENEEQMRSCLAARGFCLNNERVFVGRFCSFFTQGSEVLGLSGMAMENGGSPDFRGYILKDGSTMLVLPTVREAELAGPDRLFLNVDVVNAAASWNIAEIAFFPGASVNVLYDNPGLFGAQDMAIENSEFRDEKSQRKDTPTKRT